MDIKESIKLSGVRTTLYLPKDLHRSFKVVCAKNGMVMSHVVTALMQHFVDNDKVNMESEEGAVDVTNL